MIKKNKKNYQGFSLIEVMIVTSILSIFFTLALTVVVVSLRNMKVQEHKLLANFYADQLKEWLIYKKEEDWNDFKTRTGNYCFNVQSINNWPTNGGCLINDYSLANLFKRQVNLSFNTDANQMEILITVSWIDLNKNYQINLPLVLIPWE